MCDNNITKNIPNGEINEWSFVNLTPLSIYIAYTSAKNAASIPDFKLTREMQSFGYPIRAGGNLRMLYGNLPYAELLPVLVYAYLLCHFLWVLSVYQGSFGAIPCCV